MYRLNGNCVVNPDNVVSAEVLSETEGLLAGFIGIILLIGVHQLIY